MITFFFVLGSLLCNSLSTSGARSRAISAEQMLPRAQRASPTMNWFEWLRSLPVLSTTILIPKTQHSILKINSNSS